MLAVISYPPIPVWDIGPFQFSLHGVFAAVGFVAGAWLATRELRKRGFDTVKYQSALTWGLIGALIGARYFTSPAQLLDGASLADALNPLRGNFSIMGGFAGGILAGGWRMRQVGLPVLPTLDLSAFGLALGTIVGRIGDLIIVEHLGKATTAPWGYGIRPGYDVAPVHNDLECIEATARADGLCGIYHHVAAYDMLGAVVLIGVLYLLYRNIELRYGQLFFAWVTWYGIQRFLLDSLRFGSGDATVGALTWNQLSGFLAGLGGLVILWWLGRNQPVVSPEADRRFVAAAERVDSDDGDEDEDEDEVLEEDISLD
ncbi:MAG TPA: prolipoprotein diacylglyceryl transferase family protein [Acidimicrobiia bacterium]|nr:prolipoprotein diacylglyceryl transferase family protein [Acidimicrobiia bacterium]